jgi:hypothetical protein
VHSARTVRDRRSPRVQRAHRPATRTRTKSRCTPSERDDWEIFISVVWTRKTFLDTVTLFVQKSVQVAASFRAFALGNVKNAVRKCGDLLM